MHTAVSTENPHDVPTARRIDAGGPVEDDAPAGAGAKHPVEYHTVKVQVGD